LRNARSWTTKATYFPHGGSAHADRPGGEALATAPVQTISHPRWKARREAVPTMPFLTSACEMVAEEAHRQRQLIGTFLGRALPSGCGLGDRRFFPALGPGGWNGPRRAAYSAAVLPGALVVGARGLAILGNLLDCQRLSSSARLSSRQHGRLLVSLSRHSIGRARMQARNCRESEVGPPRLSIHSRASRAPLLLLQPLGGNRSVARPDRSRPARRVPRSSTGSAPDPR
jgi:hypothetical protein